MNELLTIISTTNAMLRITKDVYMTLLTYNSKQSFSRKI